MKAPCGLQPRNLVVVDENAQVQIIERHQSLKEHPVVTNCVTEIYVHQNAFLDYYKLQKRSSFSFFDRQHFYSTGKKQPC